MLLLSEISADLNLISISSFWVDPIRGFMILAAVLIDAQKVRFRRLEREAAIEATAPLPPAVSTAATAAAHTSGDGSS